MIRKCPLGHEMGQVITMKKCLIKDLSKPVWYCINCKCYWQQLGNDFNWQGLI